MAKRKIPTVNEKLLEKYIRHAIYVEQLKSGTAKKISGFLKKDVIPKIKRRLTAELSKTKSLKVDRLNKILNSVDKISAAGTSEARERLVKELESISRFEASWNEKTIKSTVPLDIDETFSMPSNEVLKQLVTKTSMDGHKLGTWLKGYNKSIRSSMMKSLRGGIVEGESIPKLGKRIEKVLGYKTKQAEFIARTAVSNVVHSARDEVFKKNDDLIRGVQWVSTLDMRTTLICINLDGKVYNQGEGERPPAHFNCRSTISPVVTSWSEFGVEDPPAATRASMNGAVPEKVTYKGWLRKQNASTQDKILGKVRGKLYRQGKVRIDRFVDKDYKPLTLKQVARREGIKYSEIKEIQGK